MPDLYVIGHINPDTDTIGSAIGYAWLLRQRDGVDAIPARAGGLNPQTTWVLNKLGIDAPVLLTDASPRFEAVTHLYDTTTPDQPLSDAWVIASRTGGIAPVINPDGKPYGLVHGWSLFSYLSETVGPHPKQHGMEISDILNAPCKSACDTNVPAFRVHARIRDSLHRILRSDDTDFWVVDEEGNYVGICHQRELLNPPR
jgi:manganese-dependent inorganic pyrophosphatase